MPLRNHAVENGRSIEGQLKSSWLFASRLRSWTVWLKPFVEEPVQHRGETSGKSADSLPVASIALCGLSIAGLVCQAVAASEISHEWLASAIVPALFWGAAAIGLALVRPRTGSFVLAFTYFWLLAAHVSIFVALWPSHSTEIVAIINVISTLIALLALVVVLSMPLRDPRHLMQNISYYLAPPKKELRSPEDNLTIWQWMTVNWMAPMIKIGSKRQLNDEDVWSLPYEFQHTHLHNTFRDLNGTVVRRLLRANWIDIALLSVLAIVEMVANYSAPLFLQQLLRAMENIQVEKRPALTFAGLILAVRLVAAQSSVFSLWFGRRCYERSRGEMITMLYEKTLNRKILGGVEKEYTADKTPASTEDNIFIEEDADGSGGSETIGLLRGIANGGSKMSGKSRTGPFGSFWQKIKRGFSFASTQEEKSEDRVPTSMGKLLNLMRNDVYEVAQRFWEVQTLVNKPIGLTLSIVLVWQVVGWPCLVGIAVVIVAQVLNTVLAKVLIAWEKVRRVATDARLQKTSQYGRLETLTHVFNHINAEQSKLSDTSDGMPGIRPGLKGSWKRDRRSSISRSSLSSSAP